MLDHIVLSVSDYEKAKAFYLKALAPIGYELVMEFNNNVAGIGIGKKPYLIIHGGGKQTPRFHVAFRADNRAIVDAFYKAAIDAGGTDNGVPGIREKYHPNYYGAFVIAPDDHNIEVVCHEPESNQILDNISHKNNVEKNFLNFELNNPNNKPLTMSVLFRKLKDGNTYQNFRQAWLPPLKDTSNYFNVPVMVINAQSVQDPSEIISVGLIWANVQEAIEEYKKHQATEDVRHDKIDKATDQSAETRFCQIIDIDMLGS